MMKTVQLGNTPEQVSALCLGAMYFGTRQNQVESFNLLDQYKGAGGTFIDTANIYAFWETGFKGGESETVLGAWMRERQNREDLFIATKVGFGYQDVPTTLRAGTIIEECEKSLQRLGVKTIDLYYAHNDDRSTPLEETLEAFHRLHQAGKIRYIGASNTLAWRLEEARWLSTTQDWPEYCCIQQRHTYIRKKHGTSFSPQIAANEDLFDYCESHQLTMVAYSALLSGAYTRDEREFSEQYLGLDTERRITALGAVASELGATPNQVILAWMMENSYPVVPLIAASSAAQMEENLESLTLSLSDEQMAVLENAGPM